MIFNFAEYPVTVNVPELEGNWASLLYSAAGAWSGAQLDPQAGSASLRELRLDPYSFVIFAKRASQEVQ